MKYVQGAEELRYVVTERLKLWGPMQVQPDKQVGRLD
eukprot:COSAG06_NODE_34523_length_473_cov_1.088235_1_plen_36_part_10